MEDTMHGSIFVFFKRFVEASYDHHTWLELIKITGTARETYEMHDAYPTSELLSLITAASEMTGLSKNDLEERFGEFLVPDLLLVYQKYINPTWKTLDMIEYTEHVMHSAVRRDNPNAHPPVLNVTRVSPKLLIIDYYSKRKMASVAIGIIKGIAKYYKETNQINIIPVTNRNEERVQIKIEQL